MSIKQKLNKGGIDKDNKEAEMGKTSRMSIQHTELIRWDEYVRKYVGYKKA